MFCLYYNDCKDGATVVYSVVFVVLNFWFQKLFLIKKLIVHFRDQNFLKFGRSMPTWNRVLGMVLQIFVCLWFSKPSRAIWGILNGFIFMISVIYLFFSLCMERTPSIWLKHIKRNASTIVVKHVWIVDQIIATYKKSMKHFCAWMLVGWPVKP